MNLDKNLLDDNLINLDDNIDIDDLHEAIHLSTR